MASIQIDSKIVIEACEILIKRANNKISLEEKNKKKFWDNAGKFQTGIPCEISNFDRSIMNIEEQKRACSVIKDLSEHAKSYGGEIHLDQQDFALIGEYLPKPKKNPKEIYKMHEK
ncbi:MAG: hypothetical protein QQN55_08610, partial [Nitrosopumilus sp.]